MKMHRKKPGWRRNLSWMKPGNLKEVSSASLHIAAVITSACMMAFYGTRTFLIMTGIGIFYGILLAGGMRMGNRMARSGKFIRMPPVSGRKLASAIRIDCEDEGTWTYQLP